MSYLKILNVFNHTGVSVVYVDTSLKVRPKHVLRNIFPIACIMFMFSYYGCSKSYRDYKVLMQTVSEMIHIVKYSANAELVIFVMLWMFRSRGELVSLYEDMIDLEKVLHTVHPSLAFASDRHRSLKVLILLAVLSRLALSLYHCYILFAVRGFIHEMFLILQGNVVIELVFELDKVYVIYFAIYLAKRYAAIRLLVRTGNTVLLMALFAMVDRLLTIKRRLAQTLGALLLYLVLETFVGCCVHAYLLMDSFTDTEILIHAFANTVQLVMHLGVFLTLTYFYESVETQEAELRNALKSIQYVNLRQQTTEQKDFYDLVNLKLMMESPKITACGLFEINLQIFYNVFAAIITYIVILFQFRGFEKAPASF